MKEENIWKVSFPQSSSASFHSKTSFFRLQWYVCTSHEDTIEVEYICGTVDVRNYKRIAEIIKKKKKIVMPRIIEFNDPED